MDRVPQGEELPIRQILNANLAWVRRDVGPNSRDEDLLTSLQKDGLQLPLLLTTELVVADGARRLVRARELGWNTIPVIITTDWNLVCNYYSQVRQLNAAGFPNKPMSWQETLDLISGPLDTLYRERRLERRRNSKKINAARRAKGELVGAKNKHEFITEAAEALGWKASDLRSIREINWTIDTIGRQDAASRAAGEDVDRVTALNAELAELEKQGTGLYSLLRKVRQLAAGKPIEAIRSGQSRRAVGNATLAERQAASAAMPVGQELDLATMQRLAKMLENLAIETTGYTRVRPTVLGSDATTAADQMKKAVVKLNGTIRMLKQYTTFLEETS